MENFVLEGFTPRSGTSNRKQCTCRTTENKVVSCNLDASTYPRSLGNAIVYNLQLKSENVVSLRLPAEKECKCFPTEPIRPCPTLNCECITRDKQAFSRKAHKSFCPSYKHKETCPVTKMDDEELDPDAPPPPPEEDVVPLPYGLPPLKFGPCPVPGRPCAPDGAARLLKNMSQPQPPLVKEVTGKITCSKEFLRIKQAMLDFQAELNYKPDFICINKFQVDTEKRCCDDQQRLLKLLGKSCCAEHKLAAQALFKERAEREASERRNALPPS